MTKMPTYRMIVRIVLALAICVSLWGIGDLRLRAQNKTELQKQKDKLNEQIEDTKRMIREAEKDQKNTTAQVKILNQQIAMRKELLAGIDNEIFSLGQDIENKDQEIGDLQTQTDLQCVQTSR
jgi:septal ring factor EnvC (AmiA/AmiB activator)